MIHEDDQTGTPEAAEALESGPCFVLVELRCDRQSQGRSCRRLLAKIIATPVGSVVEYAEPQGDLGNQKTFAMVLLPEEISTVWCRRHGRMQVTDRDDISAAAHRARVSRRTQVLACSLERWLDTDPG